MIKSNLNMNYALTCYLYGLLALILTQDIQDLTT